MQRGIGFLWVLAAAVAVMAAVAAPGSALACVVRGTCLGGEVETLRMSSTANAHAGLPGTGYGTLSVCCSAASLGTACTGTEGTDFDYLLFLRQPADSHVEWVNLGTDPRAFANPACISVASGQQVHCESPRPACSPGYTCIVQVSSGPGINDHIADCSIPTQPYAGNKVCCIAQSVQSSLTFIPPTPPHEGSAMDPNNPGVYVNWFYLRVAVSGTLDSNLCTFEVSGPSFPTPFTTTAPVVQSGSGPYCESLINNGGAGLLDGSYLAEVRGTSSGQLVSTLSTNPGKRVILVFGDDPPTSTVTVPANQQAFPAGTWPGKMQGTASDQKDGIQKVELTIRDMLAGTFWNGNSFQSSPVQVLTTLNQQTPTQWDWEYAAFPGSQAEGYFLVVSNATDQRGFSEHAGQTNFANFYLDHSPPTTVITTKMNGAVQGNQRLTYQWAAQEHPASQAGTLPFILQRVEYRLSPCQAVGSCTPGSWQGIDLSSFCVSSPGLCGSLSSTLVPQILSFPVTLFAGLNRMEVRSHDLVGNIGPADEDYVTYDGTYPSVTIEAPDPLGSPYNDTFWRRAAPLRGKASDDGTITSLGVSIQRMSDMQYWDPQAGSWQPAVVQITAENTAPAGQKPFASWQWPFRSANPSLYVPTDADRYLITATATDNSGKASIGAALVDYDHKDPVASFTPLPTWTNVPPLVQWSGVDEGTGIRSYLVEYSAQDLGGTAISPWAELLPEGLIPTSATLQNPSNNYRYSFRVTATDFAINKNDPSPTIVSTSVDFAAPHCAMAPFPGPYGKSPLSLAWTVTEQESGVQAMNVEVKQGSGQWLSIGDPYLASWGCTPLLPSSRSATCPAIPEGQYSFRCSAADIAGNGGQPSTEAAIQIDNTPPAAGAFLQPPGSWATTIPFTLEWSAPDQPSVVTSGTRWYHVDWSATDPAQGATWQPLGSGSPNLAFTSLPFGSGTSGEPVMSDGDTVWFQARGEDQAGNIGPWTTPAKRVAIDTMAPVITVNATDPTGKVLVNHTNVASFSKIKINSQADDPPPLVGAPSNVQSHVVWVQRTDEGIFLESYPSPSCAPTLPPVFCSTADLDIGSASEIVYWSEAEDAAGNKARSQSFSLSTHPLANFVNHEVLLPVGSQFILLVQVRNLNPLPLLTLDLDLSGYPLAGFIDGGTGNFPAKPVISPDGRSVQISNLQPGGRGVIPILVSTSSPGDAGDLILQATAPHPSQPGTLLTDQDVTRISATIPTSFSALPPWAAGLLVGMGVLLYLATGRRQDRPPVRCATLGFAPKVLI